MNIVSGCGPSNVVANAFGLGVVGAPGDRSCRSGSGNAGEPETGNEQPDARPESAPGLDPEGYRTGRLRIGAATAGRQVPAALHGER
jgi:hypothetical protein